MKPTQPLVLVSTLMFIGFGIASWVGKLEGYQFITLACFIGAIATTYLAYRK